MNFFSVLTLSAIFFSCNGINESEKNIQSSSISYLNSSNSNFGYKVFVDSATNTGGWGYDIFQDSVIIINQKFIPAVQGYSAFKSKQDAEKVALLVTKKLRLKIFPPSINKAELDSLNIKY